MILTCPSCGRGMEVPETALHKRVRCAYCQHVFRAELLKAVILDDETTLTGDIPGLDDEDNLPLVEIISRPVSSSTPNKPDGDLGNLVEALDNPQQKVRRSGSPRRDESEDALTRMAGGDIIPPEREQPAGRPLPPTPLCLACGYQGYMHKKSPTWVIICAVVFFPFGLFLLFIKKYRCSQCGTFQD